MTIAQRKPRRQPATTPPPVFRPIDHSRSDWFLLLQLRETLERKANR